MLAIITVWRRKWQPTPLFLPGTGYSPWGYERVGHAWATHTHILLLLPLRIHLYYCHLTLKMNWNLTFSVPFSCTPPSGLWESTHSHGIQRCTLFLTINTSLESPAATIFILFLGIEVDWWLNNILSRSFCWSFKEGKLSLKGKCKNRRKLNSDVFIIHTSFNIFATILYDRNKTLPINLRSSCPAHSQVLDLVCQRCLTSVCAATMWFSFAMTLNDTRPFRYDLNQIPYDYTVEVTTRFKGLDLTDRVPEELWTEVRDIVQEAVIKTITKKMKWKKGKMVLWGGLTNSWEKKRSERQRRKGKIFPFECRVLKNSKQR